MVALQKKRTVRLSPLREYREVNRLRSGLERSYTFRLIRLFSEIGNQAADAVESGGVSGARGLYPDILRRMDSTLRQLYEETIKVFSDRAIANRRSAKAVASFEDIFTTFIRTQGAERVTEISVTTQRIIQNTIEANSTAGVDVIARAIRDRFEPRFSRARATTIARTEIHNASSYATHEQQKSFAVPEMQKQWMANTDGRTRGTHAAASGKRVGVDEDFIVGGRKMAYPGDPRGGAAEVINCRCVLLYVEPEEEVEEAPTVVVAANPKRKPKMLGIDEIQIVAKALAIDRMQDRFKQSQSRFVERDPDGLSGITSRFRRRAATDFGKAKAGTLSKDATSITNALLEETDQLAAITGVLPLRGLKGISGGDALADMGDAVIGIKGKRFSALAEKAVKGKDKDVALASTNRRIDELTKEKTDIVIDTDKRLGGLEVAFPKYVKTRDGQSGGLNQEDFDFFVFSRRRHAEIDDELYELRRQRSLTEGVPPDGWKWGDEVSSRPWTSDAYFSDPLDKMRSTIYHEFGHNVHQQYLVTSRANYFTPEVEKWMKSNAKPGTRKSATRYGDKNEREWFAENFSMYFMDREDLVDPLFIRLIESIINKRPFPDV